MTFKKTLAGLMLVLGLAALPTLASAAEGYIRTGGNMRAGPATSYPAVAGVSRGESVEVYGCLSRYSWCDIAVGGDRGWYQGSRIEMINSGRRMILSGNGSLFGLTILTFALNDYWGNYYEQRPWFNDHRWRRGQYHRHDNNFHNAPMMDHPVTVKPPRKPRMMHAQPQHSTMPVFKNGGHKRNTMLRNRTNNGPGKMMSPVRRGKPKCMTPGNCN